MASPAFMRARARADRERAAVVKITMQAVWQTIEQEMARYRALDNERRALLARADDAEQTASEIAAAERGQGRRKATRSASPRSGAP